MFTSRRLNAMLKRGIVAGQNNRSRGHGVTPLARTHLAAFTCCDLTPPAPLTPHLPPARPFSTGNDSRTPPGARDTPPPFWSLVGPRLASGVILLGSVYVLFRRTEDERELSRHGREQEAHQRVLQREEAARAIMSDARGKAVGSEEFVKIREQKAIEVEERDERREGREINREKSEEEYAKRRDQREQQAHHLMLLREEAARAAFSDARGKAVGTVELLKMREQRAIEEEERGKRREQREIEVEERGKRREQREINREEKEEEYARRRDQREEEDARYKAVDREELLKIQEQRAIAVEERGKRREQREKEIAVEERAGV